MSTNGLVVLIDQIEALHSSFHIYSECECEDTSTPEHVEVEDVGTTCDLRYVSCRECCTENDYATGFCADNHQHTLNPDDRCPTIRLIADARSAT